MGFLKNIEKTFSANHKFLLVGLLVITLAIGLYTQKKGKEGMSNKNKNKHVVRFRTREGMTNPPARAATPATPAPARTPGPAKQAGGANSNPSLASAPANRPGPPPPAGPEGSSVNAPDQGSSAPTVIDPKSLLPAGAGINNPNLLQAGHHSGINTVGTSLRNANLQIRSEPANPQQSVGPWHNTTIGPDPMRRPLEIGN